VREGDGGGLGGRNPPQSHFSSKGGMVVGCWKETASSILLETQGRGMAVGSMETVPPSRLKHEGGGWGLVEGDGPLRLALGWWWVGWKTPLRLTFLSEGGMVAGWKETALHLA